MLDISAKTAAFRKLHVPGDPVIAPTVWDAWSARIAESLGFQALTIGSHPVADSVGKPDGEGMKYQELVYRAKEIARSVQIPVSLDVESGYGLSGGEIIDGILTAGVAGLNIEDTVHSDEGRLRSPEEHADLIRDIREQSNALGLRFVINARTDLFLRQDGAEEDRVDRAVARLKLCAQAGADSLYPVGFHSPELLKRLVDELPLPVNAIARPEQDNLAELKKIGVGRISFGPFLQGQLVDPLKSVLEPWKP
ncbi:isocitrate lyase/PEP mutase family protein [Segniliparus rotundus]|uniref:isocitrate lyase/PEP mutase family protein n=1 Tax=Segniliparus rotundus TaxID=286802 RepID=UPI00059DCBF6|nr:isocitrate lyase/phosphoenolpyruvate mutase family protein [Segniliparus rotundus]